MNRYNYEPEEFARARYWQEKYLDLEKRFQQMLDEAEERHMKFFCKEMEKVEKRVEEGYRDKLARLTEEAIEYKIRLDEHREEMEIFNIMPWYERLFHKFDLDNM